MVIGRWLLVKLFAVCSFGIVSKYHTCFLCFSCGEWLCGGVSGLQGRLAVSEANLLEVRRVLTQPAASFWRFPPFSGVVFAMLWGERGHSRC